MQFESLARFPPHEIPWKIGASALRTSMAILNAGLEGPLFHGGPNERANGQRLRANDQRPTTHDQGRFPPLAYNVQVGSRTGRSLSFRKGWGGKSELRRAVCRITSGRPVKPVRRKVPQRRYRLGGNARVRVKRCGKSAPPRQ